MVAFIIRLFGYEFSVTFGKYAQEPEEYSVSNTGGEFIPADTDYEIEATAKMKGGFGFSG
jgi:hypothetical protein